MHSVFLICIRTWLTRKLSLNMPKSSNLKQRKKKIREQIQKLLDKSNIANQKGDYKASMQHINDAEMLRDLLEEEL